MLNLKKSANFICYLWHVILVYQLFENCLKSQDYKRNLIMECAILPLLNANVFQRNAVERSHYQALNIYKEGDCWSVWSNQFGKQHRQLFMRDRNVSKGILDVIHLDVWSPIQTTTFGGCWYYVTFIDEFYMHTWIFPMQHNSEVYP